MSDSYWRMEPQRCKSPLCIKGNMGKQKKNILHNLYGESKDVYIRYKEKHLKLMNIYFLIILISFTGR